MQTVTTRTLYTKYSQFQFSIYKLRVNKNLRVLNLYAQFLLYEACQWL